jgi:drug/metabolite transporter (DMT)-like permease
VLATGAMLGAALSLLPLALIEAPSTHPDRNAILSLLALAVFGTAFAQLVMYRLIDLVGARKLSLVTYLMPAFALVYGALLLDESVTLPVLAGLGMILAGVALGSGTIAATRRRRPAEVPG